MRVILMALLAGLWLPGAALAQGWIFQQDPSSGWISAVTCAPGATGQTSALCLSLGCDPGQGPRALLSVTEGQVPPEFDATIAVDGGVAGVLDFRRDDTGITFQAPLDEQDTLLQALQGGQGAEIRLEAGAKPIVHPLSLVGSRDAIAQVLAACPTPAAEIRPGDSIGQDLPGRTSDDPAADAIAENEATCAGGATSVEPGFLTQTDVDGDGVNDVLIDYLGLTCDGSRAFCGTGGCSQEIWLGATDGPYRLLLADLIQQIEQTAPGRIRIHMEGGDCGLSGAESCIYDYRIEGGALRLLD